MNFFSIKYEVKYQKPRKGTGATISQPTLLTAPWVCTERLLVLHSVLPSVRLLVVEQFPSLQRKLQVQGGPQAVAPPPNLAPLLNETCPLFILSQVDFWSYSSMHSSAFELSE